MNTYVIVPYRNREEHLPIFLKAIRKKLPDAPILIIEQVEGKPFNRAKLLNIGGVVAFQSGATHIITHDVDMIPIESTVYTLGDAVHLASAATQFGLKMPYPAYFGGVTVFSAKTFYMVNGYSNEYWGWGAEDDDILKRCQVAQVEVTRIDDNPFNSLNHVHALHDKEENKRMQANGKRFHAGYDTYKDGINNLKFELLNHVELELGVLKITVSI